MTSGGVITTDDLGIPVDISGTLNDISRRILENAASSLAGMAKEHLKRETLLASQTSESVKVKRIAITMFGLTTPGVNAAMSRLATYRDAEGKEMYQPVVFHATGSGGRTMERLIREGVRDQRQSDTREMILTLHS